jgi:hypothetical protein
MTGRRKAATKTKNGPKRLAVAKRTLKDLSAQRSDPKGGFLMQDTVIVATGRR